MMSEKDTDVCVVLVTSGLQRQNYHWSKKAACPFLSHFQLCQSVSQSRLHPSPQGLISVCVEEGNQAARVRLTASY